MTTQKVTPRSEEEMLRIEAIMLAGMRELQSYASGDISHGKSAELILGDHGIDERSKEFAKELDVLCEEFNTDQLILREKTSQKYFWFIHIYGDVEPQEWTGPFDTYDLMIEAIREVNHSQGDMRDGVYWAESNVKPTELLTIVGVDLDA